MLYTFGFMGLFTIGGLTGVFLGTSGTDIHLTETYFIVAHFPLRDGGRHADGVPGRHSLLVAEDDGAHVSEKISQLAAVVTFIGFNFTFFRNLSWARSACRGAMRPIRLSSVLKCFLYRGRIDSRRRYLLPILYLTWSLKYGEIAGSNPCRRTGLEWQTQSPPLTENSL